MSKYQKFYDSLSLRKVIYALLLEREIEPNQQRHDSSWVCNSPFLRGLPDDEMLAECALRIDEQDKACEYIEGGKKFSISEVASQLEPMATEDENYLLLCYLEQKYDVYLESGPYPHQFTKSLKHFNWGNAKSINGCLLIDTVQYILNRWLHNPHHSEILVLFGSITDTKIISQAYDEGEKLIGSFIDQSTDEITYDASFILDLTRVKEEVAECLLVRRDRIILIGRFLEKKSDESTGMILVEEICF